MKYAVTFAFTFTVGFLYSQNLVVNPGFEIFKKGLPTIAMDGFASYGVAGWYKPTEGTPDWYCNIENDSNPIPAGFRSQYAHGKSDPHSGRAFGGYGSFTNNNPRQHCEYVGGTLISPLQPGRTYNFSLWIQRGQYANQYHDTLGVYFTSEKLLVDSLTYLSYRPQVEIRIDSSNAWKLVKGKFVASGGEQYFTLGNFSKEKANSLKPCGKRKNIYETRAYYYLDDFTLADQNPSGPLSISAGQKLIFNNILFETGKSSLLASSFSTLDQIVAALKKQPTLKVTINGHTDSDGDPQTNQTLSEQRALSVRKYFISKGIDSTRISTKGFGSSQPIGTDKSKNRRVEFYFAE